MKDMLGALDDLVEAAVSEFERAGVYMPSIATALRLKADELAEKYHDDTHGGYAQ